jgi:phenylacetate-CoA ligase
VIDLWGSLAEDERTMMDQITQTETGDPIAQGRFVALLLKFADLGKRAALYNYPLFLRMASAPPSVFERLSAHAALRAAAHAYRRVPAYRRLLEQSGWRDDPRLPAAERTARLPVTDKVTYVKAFSTEDRCLDGRIPMIGTEIDESSGSSGTPFNWVRSRAELKELHRAMAQYGRLYFGSEVITVNGFSMGAWATGVNVGEALRYNGIVKSTGPDVDKILNTLRFFGPRYPYVITGYPPFLKHLVDQSEARGLDWKEYRAFGIVGGEGMSEGLRAYLEHRFVAVYSCYGASDLDIGVAAEVPVGIWIRKRAAANPTLQRALFGNDSRLPMLFQYNPLDYYVETNDQRELIITVNRLSLLSPRIRYNIHDAGGVLSFPQMLSIVRDFGLDPLPECELPNQPIFRLPFLYLFGRSDSTMSYMGANIYPEDVEQALFADPDDAGRLGAYCLELVDVTPGEQRPCVHVEVLRGEPDDPSLAERLRGRVLGRLLESNLDFRAAVKEDASAKELILRLHGAGAGPFAENSGRIKRRYILQPSASDSRV